jgi:hypothetical protein
LDRQISEQGFALLFRKPVERLRPLQQPGDAFDNG